MTDASALLTATPTSLLSWSYDIAGADGHHVATISLSWFFEAGDLSLDGATYRAGREGWRSGDFFLDGATGRVATAVKPSAFTRRLEVSAGSSRYTLRAESPFTRTFVLERRGEVIGSVRRTSLFSRRAVSDLPREIGLPTRVFFLWLVVLMWRRAARSSS